jgi:diacylglycerol kinase
MEQSEAQALERYHHAYRNDLYQAIQITIVADICGVYQAREPKLLERALSVEPMYGILNLITDTGLEFCGHPLMKGRLQHLINALVTEAISSETVQLLAQFFATFDNANSLSAEFSHITLALLMLRELRSAISRVTDHTAQIHSVEGNQAHDLVSSAELLVQVADVLLKGETDSGYLQQKVSKAKRLLSQVTL